MLAITPLFIRLFVIWNYGRFINTIPDTPHRPIGIVFGAQVLGNGRLSDALQDRMDVAIQLYHEGKVDALLLSGDNRFVEYDEPSSMMAYAIANGVPEAALHPDFGGRRTYDTCYRAKHIFEVETAVLITQEFHLYRALLLCRQMGVDSVGVSASLQPYIRDRYFAVRELLATNLAIVDLIRNNPAPVMGDPLPIHAN
ncbi:MAG: ElyC/SanA/YdcF family protein [Chloroflexota bacterium]